MKYCSVAWRQYLKRVPNDASLEEKKELLKNLINYTTTTVLDDVSKDVADVIRKRPCGNLENPVGYYKSPNSLENWTAPVWDVRGSPEYGKGRVLGAPHFTGGQYGFSVILGPESLEQKNEGQKKRSKGGKYILDTFASVFDINSCCHYRLNGSRGTFGYEPRTIHTDPGPNGKPINTPTVLMPIKKIININDILKLIQQYNNQADLYDPETNEYIPYPEKIKVHLFSCLSYP